MEAEAVWAVFLASYGRGDVPESVRRDIGGAAKRLWPTRYRRFHETRWKAAHPDEWRAITNARLRDWMRRNPEKRAAYLTRWIEKTPDYWQRWYRAHAEQERERSRRRYWQARPDRVPRARPPTLSAEERKQRNREAASRYRAANRGTIAQRERARRARLAG